MFFIKIEVRTYMLFKTSHAKFWYHICISNYPSNDYSIVSNVSLPLHKINSA